jgi:hypothetical protein
MDVQEETTRDKVNNRTGEQVYVLTRDARTDQGKNVYQAVNDKT